MLHSCIEMAVGKTCYFFQQRFALFCGNILGKENAVDQQTQFAVFKIAVIQIVAFVVNDVVTCVDKIIDNAGNAFSLGINIIITFENTDDFLLRKTMLRIGFPFQNLQNKENTQFFRRVDH